MIKTEDLVIDKSKISKKYDSIIIGGGHNGLVCAAYLAKAGKKVLVIERRPVLGGAAVSEEVYPGFTFSVCSYVVSLFRPHIIRDLELTRFGLEVLPLDCTFTPFPDGTSLARWGDSHKTREEIAKFSPKDAEIYPEFGMAMTKMSHFVKNIIDQPAPDPSSFNPKELLSLMKFGKHFLSEGDNFLELHTKLLTMSAVDFLQMFFESEKLISPMAISGIIGTFLGIRSPGTAYVLLHHYMGEIDGAYRAWGLAKGGTGAISLSCAASAKHFGADIISNTAVSNIIMKNGKATGVALSNGDEIHASHVISNVDPRATFFGLLGKEYLDDEFTSQIARYKYRGSSGKVNLALDRLPNFTSRPGVGQHLEGDITIAPGIDYLERAYDDAKYGQFSKNPFMDIVIPSLTDPTVAPPGKHVMSVFVQYAPYHLKEGPQAWPKHRESFGDAVVNTIEEYAPGLKDSIIHRQVVTPWDLEQEFGLTEGNIFHGELSLEQLLFQRPASGWARYRTPVKNLWLCGSGTHPGGGLMGGPGELAAKTLLDDLGEIRQ